MRCEYFSSMFNSGLVGESKDGLIKLDVPLKEFNIILEYIYTGKLKVEDDEEALHVLSLSQEYLLVNLSKKIEEKLAAKITLENVFKICKYCNTLGLESMFRRCCKFIHDNLKSVLDSVRVNELTSKAWEYILEERLLQEKPNSISEIDLFNSLVIWTKKNYGKVRKDQIPEVFHKIRLELINTSDLIRVVRKTKIYDPDVLLDAIELKDAIMKNRCRYCNNSIA